MSDYISAGAQMSPCRNYRFLLWRQWNADRPDIVWIMLNPSTADEKADDPTILRIETRSRQWGFGGIRVVNLFTLRATSPADLKRHHTPSRQTRQWLDAAIATHDWIIAAWGNHGSFLDRHRLVYEIALEHGKPLHALKVSKAGQPSHPLYLPYELVPFVHFTAGREDLVAGAPWTLPWEGGV